jgi:curved DNA-binding protein CbpA
MKTLYDLLGALPGDDAEALRTAFRKAVKGAHPDLNPGDPDAALKFRQIVRAHDILSDDEERAVYDHLLDLAEAEQAEAASRAAAVTMRKISFAAMTLAGVLVAIAGGYLLFLQIPATDGGHAGGGPPVVAAAPQQPQANALEQMLRFDPGLAPVDTEHDAMLRRLQEFERAFAAASPSDPAAAGHPAHTLKAAKRPQDATRTTPFPPRRRMAEQDPSRGMGFSILSGAVTPR